METCPMCRIFIQDWFTQPLSPKHTLYREIHPKRLLRILPDVAPIFIRFIKAFTFYDLTGVFFTIEKTLIDAATNLMFEPKDVVDDILLRLSWTAMTDHYIRKAPGEISLIEDIMNEACVCKASQKELIGYYLTSMIVDMKDVHSSHVSLKTSTSSDTYITIGIGATERDELYD